MALPAALNAIQKLLSSSDIEIGGARPWDPQVHDDRTYQRILRWGSLGAGEAYLDAWWDVDRLDELVCRLQRTRMSESLNGFGQPSVFSFLQNLFTFLYSNNGSQGVKRHYDLGNNLFQAMLDSHMVYTCAWWKDAKNLQEAQEAKLDLIAKKLQLKPGQRILDIGCGWGGFLKFAAERYQASGVGISISQEQVNWAKEHCRELPVEIRLQDYRKIQGTYDHIITLVLSINLQLLSQSIVKMLLPIPRPLLQ